MTFEELPEYCETHICPAYTDINTPKCEHQALCTRWLKKYNTQECPAYYKRNKYEFGK
mgnify:CR=1 FL=1